MNRKSAPVAIHKMDKNTQEKFGAEQQYSNIIAILSNMKRGCVFIDNNNPHNNSSAIAIIFLAMWIQVSSSF